MSELMYMRYKNCACCGVRLDTSKLRDIRKIKDNDAAFKFNTVKPLILSAKNRAFNNDNVKTNDFVCGYCRRFADHHFRQTLSPAATSIYPSLPISTHDTPTTSNENVHNIVIDPPMPSTSSGIADQDNIQKIKVNIPRAINSNNCIICKKVKISWIFLIKLM
jgi:hypothetical protein